MVLGGLAWLTGPALAAVEWERSALEMTAKSTDRFTVAEFHFKNTGKEPVTFPEISPDCGCVAAGADKPAYAPGESGTLIARVDLAEQPPTGRRIPIRILTQSGGERLSDILVLTVAIRSVVQFSEPYLYWKTEDALEPRQVEVRFDPSEPMKVLEVRSESPLFKVEVLPSSDASILKLIITPPEQRKRATTSIVVVTQGSGQDGPMAHRMVARVL